MSKWGHGPKKVGNHWSSVYSVVSQITLYGNNCYLDNALSSSAWHKCRQEILHKGNTINKEDSEHDTEQGDCKREDSNQPSQNVPNRGATFVALTWYGSDMTRKTYLANYILGHD